MIPVRLADNDPFAADVPRARTALFMPILCAIRPNPVVEDMYTRLTATGKRKIVALVACMRKLLIMLNSLLKQRKIWSQFL